jgi:hypothetical protein
LSEGTAVWTFLEALPKACLLGITKVATDKGRQFKNLRLRCVHEAGGDQGLNQLRQKLGNLCTNRAESVRCGSGWAARRKTQQ